MKRLLLIVGFLFFYCDQTVLADEASDCSAADTCYGASNTQSPTSQVTIGDGETYVVKSEKHASDTTGHTDDPAFIEANVDKLVEATGNDSHLKNYGNISNQGGSAGKDKTVHFAGCGSSEANKCSVYNEGIIFTIDDFGVNAGSNSNDYFKIENKLPSGHTLSSSDTCADYKTNNHNMGATDFRGICADKFAIDLSKSENNEIINEARVEALTQNTIKASRAKNLTITNNATGIIVSAKDRAINVGWSDITTITNAGTITAEGRDGNYGAIYAPESSNMTITNTGTITGYRDAAILVSGSSGTANITYAAGEEVNNTITNEADGVIQIDSSQTSEDANGIEIDINDSTITNRGTIGGGSTSASYDIEVLTDTTGNTIILDGNPTLTTGKIDLNGTGTTIQLASGLTKDLTFTVYEGQNAVEDNNVTGSSTLTITNEGTTYTWVFDYIAGLIANSVKEKYKSELVLTKIRSLLNAADYLDENGSEENSFKVFYNEQTRENVYDGNTYGAVAQLNSIKWGPITSNVFLGFTNHTGSFDVGSFLGGNNYALGLKNTYSNNGFKVSFNPMIGLQQLDITDFETEGSLADTSDLLSEFLAIQTNIEKEHEINKDSSLKIKLMSTLGLQSFPDYIAKFSQGDISVSDSIDQVLGVNFGVEYNQNLNGFIIKPYVGIQYNALKDLTYTLSSPAAQTKITTHGGDAIGYYVGLGIGKRTKSLNFNLNTGYGNTGGLIDQVLSFSLTKSLGESKTKGTSKKSKKDLKTTNIIDENLLEFGELKKLNDKLKIENERLKTENEKLKMLSAKVIEENKTSKQLIVELLKENEKIKLEKEIFKNKILENENKELLKEIEKGVSRNEVNRFALLLFITVLILIAYGTASIVRAIFQASFSRNQ